MKKVTTSRPRLIIVEALIIILATQWSLNSSVFAQSTSTRAIFNFDIGTPTPVLRQSTPFDQTSGGVTAHFGSPQDPSAFSIQSQATTFFTLSQFSGNYLSDNGPQRNTLTISFNKLISNFTLTFATIDYHDPGKNGTATPIRLTAYKDSVSSAAIGFSEAHGVFTSDTYPEGSLTFTSVAKPFNLITIVVPFLPQGAVDFLVDNIMVTTAVQTVDTTPPVTTITLTGVPGNQGWFKSNVAVSLTATDDLSGVSKTEYSFNNSSWTAYLSSFNVTTEGATNIYFRSTDVAGNVEKTKIQAIKIDKTKPIANAGPDRTANAGEVVTFDGSASSDNVGVVSYAWDFGDGSTGTGMTLTHTFNNSGTYLVSLTVMDAAGNSASSKSTVIVLSTSNMRPSYIVAAVVVVVVLSLILFFFLRKRK